MEKVDKPSHRMNGKIWGKREGAPSHRAKMQSPDSTSGLVYYGHLAMCSIPLTFLNPN